MYGNPNLRQISFSSKKFKGTKLSGIDENWMMGSSPISISSTESSPSDRPFSIRTPSGATMKIIKPNAQASSSKLAAAEKRSEAESLAAAKLVSLAIKQEAFQETTGEFPEEFNQLDKQCSIRSTPMGRRTSQVRIKFVHGTYSHTGHPYLYLALSQGYSQDI